MLHVIGFDKFTTYSGFYIYMGFPLCCLSFSASIFIPLTLFSTIRCRYRVDVLYLRIWFLSFMFVPCLPSPSLSTSACQSAYRAFTFSSPLSIRLPLSLSLYLSITLFISLSFIPFFASLSTFLSIYLYRPSLALSVPLSTLFPSASFPLALVYTRGLIWSTPRKAASYNM